tara:strand:- start:369 stop:578 length:210 start_codon:yes stop_codon:yes gene_type:complete
MLKFFLVGWACIGIGYDQKCVRLGSEVIFESYEECAQYYDLISADLYSRDKTIEMKFHCVSSGVLEDLL